MGNLDGWPVVLGFDILFDSEFSIDSDLSDLSFSASDGKGSIVCLHTYHPVGVLQRLFRPC